MNGPTITRAFPKLPRNERGVMLIEALLAILIFSIGILAVVGMQGVAIKNVTESKFRSDAAFLTNDLISTMWTDAGNIGTYNWPGGSSPKVSSWVASVNAGLPGAIAPTVTVTGASAQGGTVQIQVFWRMPEETSAGLPPHSYTVIASIFTS